jgi:DNA-binding NarL/FixJ family response regulator
VIRVFIADDHGVVRAGIRSILAADSMVEVVGEAGDLDAALAFLARDDVFADVLILDLSIKGQSGIEVLRQARALRPRLAVLVHSMYAEAQYADRMVAEGAAGYLCKDRSEEQLLDAVRSVARGKAYYTKRSDPAVRATQGHHSLTARELQVFMMLASGQSVSDVAHGLGLGISTVSTHVGKIREKLGAQTVGEIVAYAHRHGLVG